jgi:hypothetical protein
LAVAVADGAVRSYDHTTGQERMPRLSPELTKPPGGDIEAIASRRIAMMSDPAFSPDGTILAAGICLLMTQGSPDAIETRDAKSALDRLNRRPEVRVASSVRE